MPELPEIEHLRRTLEPLLVGRRIAQATLHRQDMLCQLGPHCATRQSMMVGGTVKALHRHGKNFSIEVHDGRVLGVHLGMTAQCFVTTAQSDDRQPKNHRHAVWILSHPQEKTLRARLVFRDPRRFGGLVAAASQTELETLRWSRLGTDALAVRSVEFRQLLRSTHRSLKSALLDQSMIAGLGNIYVDESLFAARLHPLSISSALTAAQSNRLHRAIQKVLVRAIDAGGSTLRDYRDGNGDRGAFVPKHQVYGRGRLPCSVCGEQLERSAIAQRTSVWCSQCQQRVGITDARSAIG